MHSRRASYVDTDWSPPRYIRSLYVDQAHADVIFGQLTRLAFDNDGGLRTTTYVIASIPGRRGHIVSKPDYSWVDI